MPRASATTSYLAGIGASGALLATTVVAFLFVVALVAFNAFPRMPGIGGAEAPTSSVAIQGEGASSSQLAARNLAPTTAELSRERARFLFSLRTGTGTTGPGGGSTNPGAPGSGGTGNGGGTPGGGGSGGGGGGLGGVVDNTTGGLNNTVNGLNQTLDNTLNGLNQTLNNTLNGLNQTLNDTLSGLNQGN